MTNKVDWDAIRSEWEAGAPYRKLAEKWGVSEGTIKSRRSRSKNTDEEWTRGGATKSKKVATGNGKVATSSNRVATGNKKVATSKPKKQNRGNPNPTPKFAKRNQAARKHGLFSRYMTETQKEIIEEMQGISIADQLWVQIEIKFSAIIQAQRVMWVTDKNDDTKILSSTSYSDFGGSETYHVLSAHEKYETYTKAMARASSEYRALVKQWLEVADEYDERRLRLEAMELDVEKKKTEIERNQLLIRKESGADLDDYKDDGFIEALGDVKVDWSENVND